uniref:Putative secreted protein n=1 Tax=Amblyomma triste TaxID=251400 RepID=A0A023G457_AMBTT
MANMRIAVVAFVCLCMVALAFAQGGVLGRLGKGQPGGRRPTPGANLNSGKQSGYKRLGPSQPNQQRLQGRPGGGYKRHLDESSDDSPPVSPKGQDPKLKPRGRMDAD